MNMHMNLINDGTYSLQQHQQQAKHRNLNPF